jgi:2-polyprenyl-3-methyl-5-hydroxy-6-metoxy-1,4-benzoquinol methylase
MKQMKRSLRALEVVQEQFGKASIKVLDLGCGFGETTTYFLKDGYDCVGVDAVEASVQKAGKLSGRPEAFEVMDATQLAFEDEAFDAVTFMDVLEHVGDPEPVLFEIARVLKKDGLLILSVPHAGWSACLDPANILKRLGKEVEHHRHYALKEVESLLGEDYELMTVERRGSGLTALLRILSFPFRRIGLETVIDKLIRKVAPYDYALKVGPLGFHLFSVWRRK